MEFKKLLNQTITDYNANSLSTNISDEASEKLAQSISKLRLLHEEFNILTGYRYNIGDDFESFLMQLDSRKILERAKITKITNT